MIGTLTLNKTGATCTSSWTGTKYQATAVETVIMYSIPTTDYDNIRITVPNAMQGATFNAVTIKYSIVGGNGTQKIVFSDTRDTANNASLLTRLQNGETEIPLLFSFKATGYSGGEGTHSASCNWKDVEVQVDYIPASNVNGTVEFSGNKVFYSIKQNSLQLNETGDIVLAITPVQTITGIDVIFQPKNQTATKVIHYSVDAPANKQTSLQQTFKLTALSLDARIKEANIKFVLSNGAESSYTATNFRMIRERRAPQVTVAWVDENGHKDRYGVYVQGKSVLKAMLTTTLDTEADPDIFLKSRRLVFANETYESGNNEFGGIATDRFSGSVSYSVVVQDSYGNENAETVGTLNVSAYSSPVITALSLQRYGQKRIDGASGYEYYLDDDSPHIWVNIEANVTPINGNNPYAVTVKTTGIEQIILNGTDGESISRSKDRGIFTRELSESQTWEVKVIINDTFESATYSLTIPKAGAIFSIESGGVAIGKRATGTRDNPKFECAYPAYFENGVFDANGDPIGTVVYSTTPTQCGTWIDGRKIYRKVYTGVTMSGSYTYLPCEIDFSLPLRIYGFIKSQDNEWHPIPSYYGTSYNAYVRISYDSQSKPRFQLRGLTGMNSGILVFEYIPA